MSVMTEATAIRPFRDEVPETQFALLGEDRKRSAETEPTRLTKLGLRLISFATLRGALLV